ncbi:MAG: dihydropteroate synthase [Actinobacteria bacterium]|nr:dihydropteroate synthase [Actinomycetota bacterium]
MASSYVIESPGLKLDLSKGPLLMGVLNVTPDSFSDGGEHCDPASAVARGLEMIAQGADIIDVGGESTRPGSAGVSADEQIRRVIPVIEALAQAADKPISIDTTSSVVARRALAAGAGIVNDVSAGRADEHMFELLAEVGSPLVLMHMLGTPADMQSEPCYEDVVGEITAFLARAVDKATAAGVHRDRIIIDPGIGFGKTVEHNLEILRRFSELHCLGRPILLGTSRKSFIGRVLGRESPRERLWGTAATVALAVAAGAHLLRVHDIAQMRQVADMAYSIVSQPPSDAS